MKKATIGIAVLSIFLFITGCGNSEDNESVSNEAPKIGVILAQSGGASFIGNPEAMVLRELYEDYNQNHELHGLTIDIQDSNGDPTQARLIYDKFANSNNVLAVIGPSRSGSSIPVAKRAAEDRIPLLSLAASNQIVRLGSRTNPWAFKFAQNDDLAAERLTAEMRRREHLNVAVLYANSGFGKSGFEVFSDAAEDVSIDIIHSSAYPSELTSPESYVQSVPDDAEALLIWGTSGAALLASTAREAGYDGQLYFSHGSASSSLIQSAGSAVEGAVVVGSKVLIQPRYLDESSPQDRVILNYRNFWNSNFSGEPSHFGGHARDAFVVIVDNLSEEIMSGSIENTRRALRDSLESVDRFYGVTGTFNFEPDDHAGLTVEAFEIYTIRNGEFIPTSEVN
jgi:branched-chain amino acid transport system substrate-binding protein